MFSDAWQLTVQGRREARHQRKFTPSAHDDDDDDDDRAKPRGTDVTASTRERRRDAPTQL